MGIDRLRHIVCDQPLQPDRRVPRAEAVQADRRRPALRTSTTSARRNGGCTLPSVNIAASAATRAFGGGLGGRRHRHAHAGAVVDLVGQGAGTRCAAASTSAARNATAPAAATARANSPSTAPTRGSPAMSVVDAEQSRPVARGVRAGAADVGVDQRHAAVQLPQLLDRGVRPGHVAAGPAHASTPGCASNTRPACSEKNGRMIVGFDPTAKLAITDAAQAAYLASALSAQAGMPATLSVLGGPIYATDPGQSGAGLCGTGDVDAARLGAYLLGDRTVLKAGYGFYYDTLTAADYAAAQTGYNVTTTSTDLRRSGAHVQVGDAGNGRQRASIRSRCAPTARAGIRSSAIRSASTRCSAAHFQRENGVREHARQQRWRVSLQRELSAEARRRGGLQRRLQRQAAGQHPHGLPARGVLGRRATTRNTAANAYLTANVPNPFNIANFSYAADDRPGALSAAGVQPDVLVGDDCAQPPAAAVWCVDQPDLRQPAARRIQEPFARTAAQPALQQWASAVLLVHGQFGAATTGPSRNTTGADAVAGQQRCATLAPRRRRHLRAAVRPRPPVPQSTAVSRRRWPRNWQVSGTWEYQPGALLDWGGQNIFFNGDLDDIPVDNPTRERWFNTDAGFERWHPTSSRRVPEARLPVPPRRRPHDAADLREHVDSAQLRHWRRAPAAVPRGCAEPLQPPAVERSEPNPQSTQFGQVTTVALNQMRFFTFGIRTTF